MKDIKQALADLVEAVEAYENGCRDSCDIWRSVNALDCTCGCLDLKAALTAARSVLEAQPEPAMKPQPAEEKTYFDGLRDGLERAYKAMTSDKPESMLVPKNCQLISISDSQPVEAPAQEVCPDCKGEGRQIVRDPSCICDPEYGECTTSEPCEDCKGTGKRAVED